MKKLVFLFAMVFAGSLVFAQNTSTINQSGQRQNADVEQAGDLNTSNVQQLNRDNDAYVRQANANLHEPNANLSNIYQDGRDNEADVEQTHTGDLAARAGVMEAAITQVGNDNKAGQRQGPHGQMGVTDATILQNGNGNEAYQ